MDGNRFDDLSRKLATGLSRRAALKAATGGLVGALGLRAAGAQVTQAQCGNTSCKNNPGKCKSGCVCCVYGNGNTRCMPPSNCNGTVACPPGLRYCPSLGRCAACCADADCDDGNACTNTDTCQGGACTPGTDLVCPPPGPCQLPGVCNSATGGCDYANVVAGTPCDDGDGCTSNTTCAAGVCGGGDPVVCTGPCEACSDGACRSICGFGETCKENELGGATVGVCCAAGREGCTGITGSPVCCGAGEFCHEIDLFGLTVGVCCTAGQVGCTRINNRPVCCGAGEFCHEIDLFGGTIGVCCPAGQVGCNGSNGFSVCCGAGETCHEVEQLDVTPGVCCLAGQEGCTDSNGVPVCCGAGEVCHEALDGGITVGVCSAAG